MKEADLKRTSTGIHDFLLFAAMAFMPMLAGCARPDPVVAAKEFYKEHNDFYLLEDMAKLQDVLTPRFHDVLKRAQADPKHVVELNPWTDGQDGWIVGEPEFKLIRKNGKTARVRLDYDFEMSGIQRKSATLTLDYSGKDGCWRIADLAGPDGFSYADSHEAWLKQ